MSFKRNVLKRLSKMQAEVMVPKVKDRPTKFNKAVQKMESKKIMNKWRKDVADE